jgi:hypothetical protein
VDKYKTKAQKRFAAPVVRWLNRMNSTCAQFFSNRIPQSGRRICRLLCATLGVFLLTAVPVLAEPVQINQVVQTLSSSQLVIDLKINTLAQDPGTSKGSAQQGPRNESAPPAPGQGTGKTESIVSGVVVAASAPSLGVETIEDGEVEGTICDCGEIMIAGGAFPKWPFLFLAAVPVVFIHDCSDCDENPDSTPTPTPPSTPTPTPTPTPEPASLLLFGTGLLAAGAGLRRRYGRTKLLKAQGEE